MLHLSVVPDEPMSPEEWLAEQDRPLNIRGLILTFSLDLLRANGIATDADDTEQLRRTIDQFLRSQRR